MLKRWRSKSGSGGEAECFIPLSWTLPDATKPAFRKELENRRDLANCRIRISRMLIAFVGMKGGAPVALCSDEPRKFFEGPDFAVRISG